MAKNANGSGSIKRREDGRWEGRLMIGFDPKTGKVRRKSVYGKTQKEARQKLTELAKQVDDATYTEPLKMTLQQWLEVWLKEYNGNIKPYSYRTYSDRIRLHIVPALGRLKLQVLNAPTVQRFINWMKDGDKETAPLSPKTVKSVHGVLQKRCSRRSFSDTSRPIRLTIALYHKLCESNSSRWTRIPLFRFWTQFAVTDTKICLSWICSLGCALAKFSA